MDEVKDEAMKGWICGVVLFYPRLDFPKFSRLISILSTRSSLCFPLSFLYFIALFLFPKSLASASFPWLLDFLSCFHPICAPTAIIASYVHDTDAHGVLMRADYLCSVLWALF